MGTTTVRAAGGAPFTMLWLLFNEQLIDYSLFKFADDTTVVGLITNKDEEEVRGLAEWCQENNLSLNVNKNEGADCGLQETAKGAPPYPHRRDHKFLCLHITDNLKWSTHRDSAVKKAQQRLFNLKGLEKFGLAPKTLTNFYHPPQPQGPPECGTVCPSITLPALQDTYSTKCRKKAKKIIKDPSHPSHSLFTPLSSRRQGQYRCIKAGTERLKNSFYLKAIRLLNSHH